MVNFRDYQSDIIDKSIPILLKHRFLYLAMEVRTGKTLTSLGIAKTLFQKNVLFVTKKKAITSIEQDYKLLSPKYKLIVINYESVHKVPDLKWDMIVCDEAHSLGAFPKPNNRAKKIKELIIKHNPYVILLSGTPTPESYSQLYHQVYGIPTNPFREYKSFYKFAREYVNIVEKKINGIHIRDYSRGQERILSMLKPYTINFSQSQAGFKTKTNEKVLLVKMQESTYTLAKRLQKDLVIEGKEEVILADTPVKLMIKLHQIYSGTIKFESGNSMILDMNKALFIKKYFDGKKIGIFYKFKEELNILKTIFKENLTTELSVFKDTHKNIALQIVSGREGISLKEADCLVYYNIDFSATSYWQSRDRMTTKDRETNKVYWVFADKGIENKIYKAVIKKKDYTIKHFKSDLLSL
jgi:superfamily II DNA or RNA helicase